MYLCLYKYWEKIEGEKVAQDYVADLCQCWELILETHSI